MAQDRHRHREHRRRSPGRRPDPHWYRFRTEWRLNAAAPAVYAVLERVEEYPAWWPQVREVSLLGTHGGTARFRSFLFYDLRVTAREVRRDPRAGVLEIAMTGDLEGRARWTVRPDGTGTRLVFAQRVEAHKRLLRLLAPPARPFFRVNHALMMRSCRRGLHGRLGADPAAGGSGLDDA